MKGKGDQRVSSKALINGWGHPPQNFHFIKGTLCKLQKNIKLMFGTAMVYCLDNTRGRRKNHQRDIKSQKSALYNGSP